MELKGGNGINFRKGAFVKKKLWQEHRKGLVATGMLAGLALVLAFTNIFYDAYVLKRRVAALDREITDIFKQTFPDVKTIVDPVHQMRVKIDAAKKSALFPGQTGKQTRTIDMLNEISKLVPNTTLVEFSRLVVGPESLSIDGNTDTFNTVDDIKNRLESATLFKKITISSANIDRTGNRVRFKLKGEF
jgi:general secretion pathway protein L